MTLRSMTGYSRASAQLGEVRIEVEIRSVNHRYLDLSLKLPAQYQSFEGEISRLVKDHVARGRVDLSVVRNDTSTPSYEMRYNAALFTSLWDAIQESVGKVGVEPSAIADSAVLQVLSRREVLDVIAVSPQEANEREALLSLLSESLTKLIEMREAEGATLQGDVLQHLSRLEKLVEQIGLQIPSALAEAQARLQSRIEKLTTGIELDQSRVIQELAILAERTDVTEELTRLGSHFQQFRTYLAGDQPGKKLEFLLQEIGRELNTCGSKVQNASLQTLVVEGKAAAEKMREQLLNIE